MENKFKKELKRRNTLALIGLVTVILIATSIWIVITIRKDVSTDSGTNTPVGQNGPATHYDVIYDGENGKTALEILEARWTVVRENGVVKIIGGREDSETEKWVFYANGKVSDVPANKYITRIGDVLEWKLEKAQP
jgi:hypothetical protein